MIILITQELKIVFLIEIKNKISARFIKGEIINLSKTETIFNVLMENGMTLLSNRIVLSVGSLAFKNLWKDKEVIEEDNLIFVNNPYNPELKSNLETTKF